MEFERIAMMHKKVKSMFSSFLFLVFTSLICDILHTSQTTLPMNSYSGKNSSMYYK